MEVGGRGQAGPGRDRLDGQIRLLQEGPGRHHPLPQQPVARARTELLGEPAGERARGDGPERGEVVDGQRLVQTLRGPVQDGGQGVGGAVGKGSVAY